MLREATRGLDLKDVYGATIGRIKEQGGKKERLGMTALIWISHSERLLQLDELLHALAVDIGSQCRKDSFGGDIIELMLGACGN